MSQKVILITGTRKGIGRYLAEYYLKQGWIVIGCSRQETALKDANYLHYICDIGDNFAINTMFADIRGKVASLDALINNAGIASMNPVLLMPLVVANRIININFISLFAISQHAIRMMTKKHNGRIVNLTTVAVPMVLEGEAAYAASKAAVEQFTRVLSREVSGLGITCNAIGLPPVDTDLTSSIPRDKLQKIIDSLAIKRMCRFEDISNVADFLLREESNYITGQIIYLGGI